VPLRSGKVEQARGRDSFGIALSKASKNPDFPRSTHTRVARLRMDDDECENRAGERHAEPFAICPKACGTAPKQSQNRSSDGARLSGEWSGDRVSQTPRRVSFGISGRRPFARSSFLRVRRSSDPVTADRSRFGEGLSWARTSVLRERFADGRKKSLRPQGPFVSERSCAAQGGEPTFRRASP